MLLICVSEAQTLYILYACRCIWKELLPGGDEDDGRQIQEEDVGVSVFSLSTSLDQPAHK